ncbi:MAG: hypothetical protein KF749_16930 [Bacteroidetes bacterium]|nr:hypothetical protein [Bacteroidota bacterium]MCW5894577.1 hypothetical protein [Bacteroidota bacterium]
MDQNLMSFKYLLHTEEQTRGQTEEHLRGWVQKYPEFVDLLFQSAYFTGKPESTESHEGAFHAFAHHQLLRYPYTLRAAALLLANGYYFEAVSLVRNMYEVLIQLRYFSKHKELLSDHVLKRRVRFRTMFEEIAPGFYDNVYGKQLSEFAHGGFGSLIFRTSYSSPQEGTTTMGSVYNAELCSYSLNQIFVVVCGMVNFLPEFFPQFSELAPPEVSGKRTELLDWLRNARGQHIKVNSKAETFYGWVLPMIEIEKNGS